ncbi:hypothetical protein FPQ18DRAFT_51909 [Pyronema domesticum]|nr:hypothetical protein FPQ18DRAFT_51909 [Pyronema domesticum]
MTLYMYHTLLSSALYLLYFLLSFFFFTPLGCCSTSHFTLYLCPRGRRCIRRVLPWLRRRVIAHVPTTWVLVPSHVFPIRLGTTRRNLVIGLRFLFCSTCSCSSGSTPLILRTFSSVRSIFLCSMFNSPILLAVSPSFIYCSRTNS